MCLSTSNELFETPRSSHKAKIAMVESTPREQIIEVVNRLFIYTDQQEWAKLENEVFMNEVDFDMTSVGGTSGLLPAKDICATWKEGFTGIDSVNHLAGNYLVNVFEETADVFAYATATHYKAKAKHGQTRVFVGTYDIKLTKTLEGWRIHLFRYQLKFTSGNPDLL